MQARYHLYLTHFLLLCVALSIPASAQKQSQSPRTNTAPSKTEPLRAFSAAIQELSRTVGHSVVQINVIAYGLVPESERAGTTSYFTEQQSSGSGVILTSDGLIMTNAHMVEGARKIRVRLNGLGRDEASGSAGTRGVIEARLLGLDRLTDLALLKIDATRLPYLELAESGELKQGQVVLAFGSPLGLENSVSMGVVSAVGRQLDPENPMIYVQTDAPINPGNSGGPLVDVEGHVVGLNTFILSQSGGSEGIGFAIPSSIVRDIFNQLRRDGHVHRGHIGVYTRTITPALAAGLNLDRDSGVIIEDIIPDSPAERAGLRGGDIILTVAGRPIRNVREFALSLFRYKIGEPATIDVLRGKEKLSVSATVIERPDDPQRFADMVNPETDIIPRLGVFALTLNDQIHSLLPGLRYDHGVIVAARAATGSAYGDDLQPGDVIYAVNTNRIQDASSLKKALDEIKPDSPFVLRIERAGILTFLPLEPK
jgi:serine protease Do